MAGSITTKTYCVVKGDKFYEGTKEEIINQICSFKFDENVLSIKFPGYVKRYFHSYNP